MFSKLPEMIQKAETISYIGKIENVIGMAMESSGNRASIGDIAMIYNEEKHRQIPVEVVGFRGDKMQLMAYENLNGVSAGSFVRNTRKRLKIPVGEFLRGRIIDATGNPMDDLGPLPSSRYYYVENTYINPLTRPPITDPLEFGVKAIDGLNTVGKGQRIGIFAGSGVGKSTLLGMIARNVKADINVIALVGERGREVREFIEKDLGPEGMKRSILVVATSDQPAMLRMKCPLVATTIARGYTPSIYAEVPKLLERSGKFEKGSITGIYTVLVEGDDTNEPVADTVRGILDGHIVLTRKLANENHFPAIDVNASISRLMVNIVPEEHKEAAARLRDILSIYAKNEDLISIGAYKSGTNPRLDDAIARIDRVNAFLMQKIDESFSRDQSVEIMKEILR